MAELHFVRSCEETAHTPLLRFLLWNVEIAFGINAPLVYTLKAYEQTVFFTPIAVCSTFTTCIAVVFFRSRKKGDQPIGLTGLE